MRYSKEKIIRGIESYLANLALIWFAILFYRSNSYYVGFLRPETQTVLFWFAVAYSIFGLFSHIVFIGEEQRKSKGHIIFATLRRSAKEIWTHLKIFASDNSSSFPQISHEEKVTLLFVLVKIFFLPIMINFMFGNFDAFLSQLTSIPFSSNLLSIDIFNRYTFFFLLNLFFLIDVTYFVFGYSVEADSLKNRVRSVEPTIFGWAVALICYPPFNGFFSQYTPWYASDAVNFGSDMTNYIMRLIFLLLVFIYLWATLSLGAKCSNLTNRGIVKTGPYRIVRHPAYIGKNLFWWISIIPVISFPAVLSMGVWSFIYFLRAITEEKHLLKDPEYQEYCKEVKFRFVPYIF